MALSEVLAPEATVTTRLLLRAPQSNDLEALYALQSDPVANRFCTCATPASRSTAQTQLDAWQRHWDDHGFGHWAIAEAAAPQRLIGFGGLMHRSVGGHAGLHLYYRFEPQAWGRGLASEMAIQALEMAFGPLNQSGVWAVVQPADAPSRKTLERLGLKLKGALADVPGRAASLLYEIGAARWSSQPRCAPEPTPFGA
jgi:RimJ/RimL family protein N-acetyltransferase